MNCLLYLSSTVKLLSKHAIYLINLNLSSNYNVSLDIIFASATKFKLFDLILFLNKTNRISKETFNLIIKVSDVEIVKWILAQYSVDIGKMKKTLNLNVNNISIYCYKETFNIAATTNIEIFKLLTAVYVKQYYYSDLWIYVEENLKVDNLENFKYFFNQLYNINSYDMFCEILAKFGRKKICNYAVKNNFVEVNFKFLENLIKYNNKECYRAIAIMNFKINTPYYFILCSQYVSVFFFREFVKKATIDRSEIFTDFIFSFAYNNREIKLKHKKKLNLKLLRYLDSENCPTSPESYTCAIKENDFEVVKYVHSKGYKFDEESYYIAYLKGAKRIGLYIIDNIDRDLLNSLQNSAIEDNREFKSLKLINKMKTIDSYLRLKK